MQLHPSLTQSHAVRANRITQGPGLILAAGLMFLAAAASARSQTWETADDISPYSGAYGITADRAGNLFVAGWMRDAAFVRRAIVMKSSDGGQTWDSNPSTPDVDEPSDDVGPLPGGTAWFEAIASARVPDGGGGFVDHVVSAGQLSPPLTNPYGPSGCHWLIRRSLDAGATWQTVDDYQHPAYDLVPLRIGSGSVAIDSSGTIYATRLAEQRILTTKGKTTTITYVNHWLIRKGVTAANGTVQWSTSDFAFPTSKEHQRSNVSPSGVVCVGSDVYVVGGGGTDGNYWRVMKSTNGGTAWTVADNFLLYSGDTPSHAHSITADSAGNLYVAGAAMSVVQGTSKINWIVRKGSPGGTNWTTVDQFQYPGGNAWARSVTVAPNGDLEVTGNGRVTSDRWVTRCRSAATGLWSTTDDFAHPGNPSTVGAAITADPSGNVFSAGCAVNAASGFIDNWLVRRKLAP